MFAVVLSKLQGLHVIGTCSSEEKKELLLKLGCDRVVNYKKEDLDQVLKTEYKKGVKKKIYFFIILLFFYLLFFIILLFYYFFIYYFLLFYYFIFLLFYYSILLYYF